MEIILSKTLLENTVGYCISSSLMKSIAQEEFNTKGKACSLVKQKYYYLFLGGGRELLSCD